MKFLYIFLCSILLSNTEFARPVKVMLITGGHDYDTLQFFKMFEDMDDVVFSHFHQPEANNALVNGIAGEYDVLVFYDMWKEVTVAEKEAYMELTKQGKPFLFLHHALVSYQLWPEYEKLLGGRYIENPELDKELQSDYKHDEWVDVLVVDKEHPVTLGMNDFRLYDEVYGNYKVLPEVKPLLRTNHPESAPVIGWENKYNASTIIYLQPGHDKNAYESVHYRRLVHQAVKYLCEK